jgi:hypothetical protein
MREKVLRLFCSRGATECGPQIQGCICGRCPVWEEHCLARYYFCQEGAAV